MSGHDPRSKEQSARRVMGTFVALLLIAAATIAVFLMIIVVVSRSKGFAIFGKTSDFRNRHLAVQF